MKTFNRNPREYQAAMVEMLLSWKAFLIKFICLFSLILQGKLFWQKGSLDGNVLNWSDALHSLPVSVYFKIAQILTDYIVLSHTVRFIVIKLLFDLHVGDYI